MRRFHPVRAAVVVALSAITLSGIAGVASATPDKEPESGDDRATAHPGNVVEKDCADLFPGSEAVDKADLTFEVDGSNTYIDITAATDVVGVIVKGGPAYNVYEASDLGDLPWLDLHSPLVPSGKPAQISHWFACAVEGTTTTTTTTTTDDTEPSTSTSSGEEPSSSAAPNPTTSQDVAPAAEEEALAETGFDAGWLVTLAALLLLGGGALLFVMRTRTARR